jgi:hypothetical protein
MNDEWILWWSKPALSGKAWVTTLVACLGVITAYLPFTGTTTALPTIALQFHASTSQLQWVSDLFIRDGRSGASLRRPRGRARA